MKKWAIAVLTASLLIALLFTGCTEKPPAASAPTPTPTESVPTPALPEVPVNSEQSLETYGSLTLEEQFEHHSIGRLCSVAASSATPGDDYYEKLRAYVVAYMEGGGIVLPDGFTVSHDPGTPLYYSAEQKKEAGIPPAKVYLTNFNTPEGEDSVFASILELESDYLKGEDFPTYIARAVLTPQSPKSTELFFSDVDGDGSLDYALRFYLADAPEESSECYFIRLKDRRFEAESVTLEAWLGAKTGYEQYTSSYVMRLNVKAGTNLTAQALEHYNALSKGASRGKTEVDGLYAGAAALTVKPSYSGGVSSWALSLTTPEGVLAGGFDAEGGQYDVNMACIDLTGDGKEEIIFSIVPMEGAGGELHVFTEREGALREMLTICNGNPTQKQAQYADSYFLIPDGFTYVGDAQRGDYMNRYLRATCISTEGINLLRIAAEEGGATAQTYLWWDGTGFEVVYQVVFQ